MNITLFLLQVIFIILKVTGTVAWGWGLVLLPLWISLGIAAIALAVFGAVAVGVAKGLNL